MIEGVDHDDLMGAEESGEEDKKEVCIQVKLGKEDKTKPSLDRYSLFVFTLFIQKKEQNLCCCTVSFISLEIHQLYKFVFIQIMRKLFQTINIRNKLQQLGSNQSNQTESGYTKRGGRHCHV